MSDPKVQAQSGNNWDTGSPKPAEKLTKEMVNNIKDILNSVSDGSQINNISKEDISLLKKALDNGVKLSSKEINNIKNIVKEANSGLVEGAQQLGRGAADGLGKISKGGSAPSITRIFPDDNIFPFPGARSLNRVSEAKNNVENIINSKDRGQLADNVKKFYDSLEGMSNNDLIKVAEFLGDKMSKTDGNDDILGSLLKGVLGKIKENGDGDIFNKIRPLMPEKIHPTFPGLKNYPDIDIILLNHKF